MNRMTLGALLLSISIAAEAVDVTLDDVVAESRRGQVRFKLDSNASFDFDPDAKELTSSGTWIAQSWVGPNELTRFSHKVEDFRVDPENGHAFRSYECVEGTLGTLTLTNLCGNYRFGPNMTDDGGLVDDVVAGPRKSLDDYELSQLDWDGSTLVVTLSRSDVANAEPYPEYSLTLRFSAAPEDVDEQTATGADEDRQ